MGWRPGLVEAFRCQSSGGKTCYNTRRKLGCNQVLWKLQDIVVQVAGLVTVPGGSWGGDHVLLKLLGFGVQVTRLVTAPGVSNGGNGGGCPPACRLAQGL